MIWQMSESLGHLRIEIDGCAGAKFRSSKEYGEENNKRDKHLLFFSVYRRKAHNSHIEQLLTMNEDSKRAQEAIDKILGRQQRNSKTSLVKNNGTSNEFDKKKPTYINYKSSGLLQESTDSTGRPLPKQRIIKIVDKQVDPMLPPSFKIKKTPQGPPEKDQTEMPILHDVDNKHKKLSAADQKNWYIPPALSNWKNTKGFAISIDKRMMGTSSEDQPEPVINDKFGSLSNALDKADQDARDEIKMRIKLQKKLEREELRKKEMNLQKIAEQTREFQNSNNKRRFRSENEPQDDFNDAAKRREELRLERRRRAEKELSSSNSSKFKLQSTITEKSVDLLDKDKSSTDHKPSVKRENVYDSNLFIKSSISNARQSEDQLYTTPLFEAESGLNDIYRARPSSGGAEADETSGSGVPTYRGPVMFQKDTSSGDTAEQEKKYGMN